MTSVSVTRGWHVRASDPPGLMRWHDGSGWTNQLTGGIKDELDRAEQAMRQHPLPGPEQLEALMRLRADVVRIANTGVCEGRRVSTTYSVLADPFDQGLSSPASSAPPKDGRNSTNGLAIASFVLSLVGLGIGSLLAVIFGHVAKSEIRRTGAAGDGMATAGLVLGYIGTVLAAAALMVAAS